MTYNVNSHINKRKAMKLEVSVQTFECKTHMSPRGRVHCGTNEITA